MLRTFLKNYLFTNTIKYINFFIILENFFCLLSLLYMTISYSVLFKNNCFIMVLKPLFSYLLKFFIKYLGLFNVLLFSCMLMFTCSFSFFLILFVNNFDHLGHYYFFSDYYYFGTWFNAGILNVNWSFTFDNLSLFMCFVVSSVSFFVHVYSIEYMRNDPHLVKFISYLSIFTFFMLLLVISDNFLVFFLGWEGIGLSSFLLISFWNTRVQAVKAAIKAILINRIGDLFFLITISLIFYIFGSVDFITVFYLYPYYAEVCFNFIFFSTRVCDLIAILLFLSAVSKSAQFGFHTWLPDAMEGPTPVSALIHAATLVTAGIFLIIRCSVIFEFSDFVLNLMMFWGSLTCVFAAITANYQVDLKKIIAYSTCSQLGYMVVACGLSEYVLSFFHLINHAFFKALLFLCAGFFIHASLGDQDIRRIGVGFRRSPLISTCLDVGLLCLISVPFFGGFFSKDVIIESLFLLNFNKSFYFFIYYICLFSSILTAGYASRISTIILDKDLYSSRVIYFNKRSSDFFMSFSIFSLTIISVCLSYYISDIFNINSIRFSESIFVKTDKVHYLMQKEYVPCYIQNLPLFLFAFVSVVLPVIQYLKQNKNCNLFIYFNFVISYTFNNKLFVDEFINYFTAYIKSTFLFFFNSINFIFFQNFGPAKLWDLFFLNRTASICLFKANVHNYICLIFIFFIFIILLF